MLVDYIKPSTYGDTVPPRLFLRPETDKDKRTLENIMHYVEVCGFGRDERDGELLHVEILLATKD